MKSVQSGVDVGFEKVFGWKRRMMVMGWWIRVVMMTLGTGEVRWSWRRDESLYISVIYSLCFTLTACCMPWCDVNVYKYYFILCRCRQNVFQCEDWSWLYGTGASTWWQASCWYVASLVHLPPVFHHFTRLNVRMVWICTSICVFVHILFACVWSFAVCMLEVNVKVCSVLCISWGQL